MRISDWSSDVCSSDLIRKAALSGPPPHREKGDRGADRRFLYLQPVVPLDHLQGAVPRREPRRILSRPHEQAVRKPGRNLSPALFDQHLSAMVAGPALPHPRPIGRAPCRGRVCQYVYNSVFAVSIKKKKN